MSQNHALAAIIDHADRGGMVVARVDIVRGYVMVIIPDAGIMSPFVVWSFSYFPGMGDRALNLTSGFYTHDYNAAIAEYNRRSA